MKKDKRMLTPKSNHLDLMCCNPVLPLRDDRGFATIVDDVHDGYDNDDDPRDLVDVMERR